MSKKTKKNNSIGQDLAILLFLFCLLIFLSGICQSCSRTTALPPDFYAMPSLETAGKPVQSPQAQNECTRHGDATHKGTQTCFFCEKPVSDEN